MPIKPPSFLTRAKTSLDPLRLPRLLCDRLELGAQGSQARGLTLISRAVARHRAFDLSALPEADRLGALRAQIAAWEPLPDAHYLVSWQGPVAQAFAIERLRLEQVGVKSPVWLPETLAREPFSHGVRLLRALDGFEGQAWKAGILRTTRWWATRPSSQEWSLFLRQAGWPGAADGTAPEIESPAWQKPGRLPVPADQLGRGGQGSEQWLAGILALVLIGFGAMSARALWESFDSRRQAQVALAEIKVGVAPVLAARDKALAAADEGAALIAHLQAPRPLEVLEELLRLLPSTGLVREADIQGMEVRVLVDLPADVSRSKVIAGLEAGGWFTQVSEARDGQPRGGLDLQMKLSAVSPPQRSNADAGLQRLSEEGLPPGPPGNAGTKP
ncbi:MAG: hypothetical protein ACT6S0_00950 [Roseateles sp.]|uniref:hypothetical protein n=1 Tax=Roseateles sp. TaxID=1971397 RepID=UPI00403504CD